MGAILDQPLHDAKHLIRPYIMCVCVTSPINLLDNFGQRWVFAACFVIMSQCVVQFLQRYYIWDTLISNERSVFLMVCVMQRFCWNRWLFCWAKGDSIIFTARRISKHLIITYTIIPMVVNSLAGYAKCQVSFASMLIDLRDNNNLTTIPVSAHDHIPQLFEAATMCYCWSIRFIIYSTSLNVDSEVEAVLHQKCTLLE